MTPLSPVFLYNTPTYTRKRSLSLSSPPFLPADARRAWKLGSSRPAQLSELVCVIAGRVIKRIRQPPRAIYIVSEEFAWESAQERERARDLKR